jgi:hypothetical protein
MRNSRVVVPLHVDIEVGFFECTLCAVGRVGSGVLLHAPTASAAANARTKLPYLKRMWFLQHGPAQAGRYEDPPSKVLSDSGKPDAQFSIPEPGHSFSPVMSRTWR